ncbi:AP-3 complex subunit delta [Orbilia brochopaga]|uniref:AP-3 complex subunit delta n=1 Tax=Orbilia brochopaga TaxID=3140254 RepID=A0AAV9UJP2_9PEZI
MSSRTLRAAGSLIPGSRDSPIMFEKSLYDLIRGLRAHKGNERAYITQSLQECRTEAKSNDMDIKCAAILKLIYLEMFGHSMAWASFHVLEVMSSQKFVQKRVGYLAAVQSFRLDTDVLMLATNLLKKDLSSPNQFELSLAINGLSHIVSPSLARDLTPDLIAKMNHSNPYIRKKAVLVMYKIFLQFPEALRTSFPRLRERLEDSDETVVSATVNVICELARKNPKNYLPLAPQLFNLLTTSKNNWMTIKIIKLFASLTPLEPRLVKKLIPPISNIIQTTTAMSLLYECINGLISGGLLTNLAGTTEGEDLAVICINKLRGFLVEGDSNLKYVALLALTKMTRTHGYLVSAEKDVILECIDDEDVSIRLRALELVVGMVDEEILQQVVGRLIRQLKPPTDDEAEAMEKEDEYDYDDEDDDGEEKLTRKTQRKGKQTLSLPDDYKDGVIRRIIEMCSKDTYANMPDFEWYIDVLVQLVRYCPSERKRVGGTGHGALDDEDFEEAYTAGAGKADVGEEIGRELRNVAVRVKTVRRQATEAAELLVGRSSMMFPATGGGGRRVLLAAAWVVGEYAEHLRNPNETIDSLIQASNASLPPDVVATYVQAIPKVYSYLTSNDSIAWTAARKSTVTLLTSRVIEFLELLSSSPHLEVQERAVGFLEIFRLGKEAIAEQPANGIRSGDTDENDDEDNGVQVVYDPPLILTQAIPSLFHGFELNPVAPRAQRKVPIPDGLDLEAPINPQLAFLLSAADYDAAESGEDGADTEADEEFERFYYQKPVVIAETAAQRIDRAAARDTPAGNNALTGSYQSGEDTYLDPDILARRKAERRERNRDDPFYIGSGNSGRTTPNPLGGEQFDIDSIPIMKLDLGDGGGGVGLVKGDVRGAPVSRTKVEIAGDEGEGEEDDDGEGDEKGNAIAGGVRIKGRKGRGKDILNIDSSNLVGFSLEEPEEDLLAQEEEVARAKKEVEKLRGEMARAAERVKAANAQQTAEVSTPPGPAEATAKKKKKKKATAPDGDGGGGETTKKKVTKKKKKEGTQQQGGNEDQQAAAAEGSTPMVKKKKKKRRSSTAEAGEGAGEDAG